MEKIDNKDLKNMERFEPKTRNKLGFFKTLIIAGTTALTFGLFNSSIKSQEINTSQIKQSNSQKQIVKNEIKNENLLTSYIQKKLNQEGPKAGDQYIYLYASDELKKDLEELKSSALSNNKITPHEFKFWKDKFHTHIEEIKAKLQERIDQGNQTYVIANQGLLKAVQEQYNFFEQKILEKGFSQK